MIFRMASVHRPTFAGAVSQCRAVSGRIRYHTVIVIEWVMVGRSLAAVQTVFPILGCSRRKRPGRAVFGRRSECHFPAFVIFYQKTSATDRPTPEAIIPRYIPTPPTIRFPCRAVFGRRRYHTVIVIEWVLVGRSSAAVLGYYPVLVMSKEKRRPQTDLRRRQ